MWVANTLYIHIYKHIFLAAQWLFLNSVFGNRTAGAKFNDQLYRCSSHTLWPNLENAQIYVVIRLEGFKCMDIILSDNTYYTSIRTFCVIAGSRSVRRCFMLPSVGVQAFRFLVTTFKDLLYAVSFRSQSYVTYSTLFFAHRNYDWIY
jgi:hypothetical protein